MRAVVVGAGIAGLTAARGLVAAGAEAIVLDKGRSPGGRMATRRIGDATLDHGAQFFTTRTPAFSAQVGEWQRRGLVRTWHHGLDGDDGHPRFVATGGMNSLAKDLADGLDVRCNSMAFALRAGTEDRWEVVLDDATLVGGDAVVITTPLPQAFSLMVDAPIDLDRSMFRTDYDRTIALLAVLDRPIAVGAHGALQQPTADLVFVADNAAKGVSARPALTVHAAPAWSEERWDLDHATVTSELEELAAPFVGDATIVDRQLKKWRFATPREVWPDPCWTSADGSIVLAGDAFAGPRVEGAYNSGAAAAHALTH